MTAADTGRLAKLLGVLAETFNEAISEVRMEAYFLALEDLPIEALEAVGRRALNLQFFPRPADLRRLVEGSREHDPDAAWLSVLMEIRRVGYCGTPSLPPSALETVRGLWGTWGRLCSTLPAEGPELLGWAKQFKASYAATAERLALPEYVGRDEAKQLLGSITRRLAEATE